MQLIVEYNYNYSDTVGQWSEFVIRTNDWLNMT